MTEKSLRLTRVFVYRAVCMTQATKKSWICFSGLDKACAQHDHCLCSSHLTHGLGQKNEANMCVRGTQTASQKGLYINWTSLSQAFSII